MMVVVSLLISSSTPVPNALPLPFLPPLDLASDNCVSDKGPTRSFSLPCERELRLYDDERKTLDLARLFVSNELLDLWRTLSLCSSVFSPLFCVSNSSEVERRCPCIFSMFPHISAHRLSSSRPRWDFCVRELPTATSNHYSGNHHRRGYCSGELRWRIQ